MTIRSFSGAAGCGKTYQLMATLCTILENRPLQDGQKVLALTFMHGSRRRLDDRLADIARLNRRFDCSTLDSFAWRIVCRWRALLAYLGEEFPDVGAYERVCELASILIARHEVVRWVAATFPVVVVDEAQDLTPNRLAIVQSLEPHVELLVASDEFQCLVEELRPNAACEWLTAAGNEMVLEQPQRTNDQHLLAAASAVRSGQAPVSAGKFKVVATPNAGMAGTWISNAISWNREGNRVAIITPTMGTFANQVRQWVESRTTSRQNGPHTVNLEQSEAVRSRALIETLALPDHASLPEAQALIADQPRSIRLEFISLLDRQRRTKGQAVFSREEMELAILQIFANQRRFAGNDGAGVRLLTVHGAKNREFDLVLVLWPAAIGGDEMQKRRLLYNAITRAKSQCLVFVQSAQAMALPPFT
ncbi:MULTISPECIES: ATP-dependent helicase [unclassified Pseudomonas]|uniref:ATP-dependent helicase n=1 Tax=unclassified Pseudomonas TaxID=196821 RepID=UPI0023DF5D8E|nr:ATP-dependent helicase [Pseudomonas sp. 1912-s]MDF3202965.1 ATP-dependent helicase [Pseudomonas sp. 1912-s]